jgi:hypothetical protein
MSLDIEFEGLLSLSGLVKTMKAYRYLNQEQREKITGELEELIRKLFYRELRVKGYYLAPGRGGSGVVLMRPIVEGTTGQYFVVKFGLRENIARELKNYNLYVKPFIGTRATQLVDIVDEPIETLNLGGLKFSFAGMSRDNPRDFNMFYRDPVTTEEQLCKSLRHLFNESCANWYEAKRDWPEADPDALAAVYESQLSLDRPAKQRKLVTTLEALLNDQPFQGIAFEPHGDDSIKIHMDAKRFILPEPFCFVKNYRTAFPTPRFQCRIHGDLNGRNMFVDEDSRVWLIDFFNTRWGPISRDFGELETVIKFELLETNNLMALYEFEKALLNLSSFDEPITLVPQLQQIGDISKAATVITQLHHLAQEKFESSDMQEYYVGLLFYALKMLTWRGITAADRDRYPIRQRHALLSAAMIAYKLKHWERQWSGWPDEQIDSFNVNNSQVTIHN